MTRDTDTPDRKTHDVDAVPFHCIECNTDVKLKAPTAEESRNAAIGCQCELMNIIDFTGNDIPEKWAQKGAVSASDDGEQS